MSFDPQTLEEHSRRLKQHAEKMQRDQRRNARLAARPRTPLGRFRASSLSGSIKDDGFPRHRQPLPSDPGKPWRKTLIQPT